MFDNKIYLHINLEIQTLLSCIKKGQYEKTCELGERKRGSGRNPMLSDKLVRFILDILLWNNSFMWDVLSNIFLNTLGKHAFSRTINRVFLVHQIILTKSKLSPKFNESIRKLRLKILKENLYIENNFPYRHK